MPNWKKLIVSGSDATLNSLHATSGAVVSGSLTASLFANGSDNQYFHIDNRFVSESHTDGNIGIQFSYGGNYQSRIISRKSQDFVGNLDYDGDFYSVNLVTSNRSYRLGALGRTDEIFRASNDIKYWAFSGAVLADMDASDTAHIILRQKAGAYGTLIVQTMSHFSGYKAL